MASIVGLLEERERAAWMRVENPRAEAERIVAELGEGLVSEWLSGLIFRMVLLRQANSKLFEGPGGGPRQRCNGDAMQVQEPVPVLELVGKVGAGNAQQLGQEGAGDRPASS